jgi:hypothetical protein
MASRLYHREHVIPALTDHLEDKRRGDRLSIVRSAVKQTQSIIWGNSAGYGAADAEFFEAYRSSCPNGVPRKTGSSKTHSHETPVERNGVGVCSF